MAEEREDWRAFRAFSRDVFGVDPGPMPEEEVPMSERRAYKASGSVKATLSAELAAMYGVDLNHISNGESVETRQFANEHGLFIPWDDLRRNGDRRRD